MLNQRLLMGDAGSRYLYNQGELYSGTTGGWSQEMDVGSSSEVMAYKGVRLTLGSDCMFFSGTANQSSFGDAGATIRRYYRCSSPIDLSRYKTLHIEYSRAGDNADRMFAVLGASPSARFNAGTKADLGHTNGLVSTASVNISGVWGEQYVYAGFSFNTNASFTMHFYVYKIWLE